MSFSFLACLLVASLAFVYGQEIGLPGGSEDILTNPYVDSFSCEGQAYGYYADVDNACEIFHICLPIQDNEGNTALHYAARMGFIECVKALIANNANKRQQNKHNNKHNK